MHTHLEFGTDCEQDAAACFPGTRGLAGVARVAGRSEGNGIEQSHRMFSPGRVDRMGGTMADAV